MTEFSVELLPGGIVRFVVPNFTRPVVDAWEAHVRKYDGKLPSPVRSLYIMRNAGVPTPYLIETISRTMNDLIIPEDTRSAFVVSSQHHLTFGEIIAEIIPKRAGEVAVFADEDEAIRWLSAP